MVNFFKSIDPTPSPSSWLPQADYLLIFVSEVCKFIAYRWFKWNQPTRFAPKKLSEIAVSRDVFHENVLYTVMGLNTDLRDIFRHDKWQVWLILELESNTRAADEWIPRVWCQC